MNIGNIAKFTVRNLRQTDFMSFIQTAEHAITRPRYRTPLVINGHEANLVKLGMFGGGGGEGGGGGKGGFFKVGAVLGLGVLVYFFGVPYVKSLFSTGEKDEIRDFEDDEAEIGQDTLPKKADKAKELDKGNAGNPYDFSDVSDENDVETYSNDEPIAAPQEPKQPQTTQAAPAEKASSGDLSRVTVFTLELKGKNRAENRAKADAYLQRFMDELATITQAENGKYLVHSRRFEDKDDAVDLYKLFARMDTKNKREMKVLAYGNQYAVQYGAYSNKDNAQNRIQQVQETLKVDMDADEGDRTSTYRLKLGKATNAGLIKNLIDRNILPNLNTAQ